MFDIGAAELLVIIVVAIIVIGPSEMPRAMRTAGRWIGQVRKVSAHFRTGIDAMVREAELEDMEKKWKAQNEEIMRRSGANAEAENGAPVMTGPPPHPSPPDSIKAVADNAPPLPKSEDAPVPNAQASKTKSAPPSKPDE